LSWNRRLTYCDELARLIATCDPNDPAPDVVDAIERHIAQCEICAGAESWFNETGEALRGSPAANVSASFETSLIDRLCQKDSKSNP
jgi:hypothetical protein